jgi:hypothetical protein
MCARVSLRPYICLYETEEEEKQADREVCGILCLELENESYVCCSFLFLCRGLLEMRALDSTVCCGRPETGERVS